jgi:hypothetical protein
MALSSEDREWIESQNKKLKEDLLNDLKGQTAAGVTADHFIEGVTLGGLIVFVWLRFFVKW